MAPTKANQSTKAQVSHPSPKTSKRKSPTTEAVTEGPTRDGSLGLVPDQPMVLAVKKEVKRRQKSVKASRLTKKNRGVVYLGNLPYGFHEDQMRTFFTQFGNVTRVYMPRSKSTTNTKGYAFVEFEHSDVAEVVAQTMNNYLMHNRLVKCQYKPYDALHPETFKNAHKKFRLVNWRKLEAKKRNSEKTPEQLKRVKTNMEKRQKKKQLRLAELGIDYEVPAATCLVTKQEDTPSSEAVDDAKQTQKSASTRQAKRARKETKTNPNGSKTKRTKTKETTG